MHHYTFNISNVVSGVGSFQAKCRCRGVCYLKSESKIQLTSGSAADGLSSYSTAAAKIKWGVVRETLRLLLQDTFLKLIFCWDCLLSKKLEIAKRKKKSYSTNFRTPYLPAFPSGHYARSAWNCRVHFRTCQRPDRNTLLGGFNHRSGLVDHGSSQPLSPGSEGPSNCWKHAWWVFIHVHIFYQYHFNHFHFNRNECFLSAVSTYIMLNTMFYYACIWQGIRRRRKNISTLFVFVLITCFM